MTGLLDDEGSRFKEERIKRGFLTRPELAKVIGWSDETIKKWERNERQIPERAWIMLRSRRKKLTKADSPAPSA